MNPIRHSPLEAWSTEAPLVSVAMITYNQAEYITQAIESVLMQATNFPVELVIGEDCSTDATRGIVQEYAARHPDIIRPILHAQNMGMGRNAASVFQSCRGKYIAVLEGDDYWTDKHKLMRQVEFMEREPDCAVCHHRILATGNSSSADSYEYPPEQWRRERVDGDELLDVNFIQTCSVLYRAATFPTLTEDFIHLQVLDWPIAIISSRHGWVGYLDRCMAVYRLHASSSWQAKPFEQRCYHTLKMFEVVEQAIQSSEREHVSDRLNKTRLQMASACRGDHQPAWTRKVARICLNRARAKGCKRRYAFLLRAAILFLTTVLPPRLAHFLFLATVLPPRLARFVRRKALSLRNQCARSSHI